MLTLARPLVDGEQVLVGAPAAVTAPGAPAGVPGGAATPLVDLNTADQALLETLPGVGPVTAAAILASSSAEQPVVPMTWTMRACAA